MRLTTERLHDDIRAMHASAKTPSDDLARSMCFVRLAENQQQTRRRNESNWLTKMESVELFTDRRRRLPRHTLWSEPSLANEGRLADWLDTQRDNRHRLCDYQQRRLEALPEFIWDPREERWQERLRECQQFLLDRGRPPRIRSYDPAERSLARWIYDQRARHRARRLRSDQSAVFAPFSSTVR